MYDWLGIHRPLLQRYVRLGDDHQRVAVTSKRLLPINTTTYFPETTSSAGNADQSTPSNFERKVLRRSISKQVEMGLPRYFTSRSPALCYPCKRGIPSELNGYFLRNRGLPDESRLEGLPSELSTPTYQIHIEQTQIRKRKI